MNNLDILPSAEEARRKAASNQAHVQSVGRKDDGGKLDLTLLIDDLPHALEGVCEVLQWATTKKQPVPYARGSWQNVDDFHRRYRAAMLRHILNASKAAKTTEYQPKGRPMRFEEATDHETGLLELAHIATDALFMLEMAVRKARGPNFPEGA